MIEALLAMYEKNLDYSRRLVADIPDARATAQPSPQSPMNHAAWVLGHLAQVADFYGTQLGLPATAPKEWGAMFGGSSKPSDGQGYPSKAALLKALEDGHARVAAAVRAKETALWQTPPADEKRRQRFPTMGHFLVHVLINHEAIHLGQLSAWRRVQGLPSV